MTRWLLVLVGTAAAFAVLAPTGTQAADKSFSLPSLEVTAVVGTDGSMQVTERVTYEFSGGPFNFGIHPFDSRVDQVQDFAVSDDQGPLAVIPPDSSVSGDWEWQLRGPTSDTTETFVVTFRVVDAVTYGSDVTELNWAFVGRDQPGIGRVTIDVTLPGQVPPAAPDVADDDTTVLRGFAHGPSDGRVSVDTSSVRAEVDGLASGQLLEVVAVVPASTFDRQGSTAQLASILQRERDLVNGARDAADRERLGWILTPILGALGLAGTGALWFVGGREKQSTEVLGDYWREPLDLPPAVAVTNLHRGTVQPNTMIAGTLVDLAQRGYLKIIGRTEERFGPDQTVHEFHWLGKPTADLLPFERDLLEMVFRGQSVTTSDELTGWARKHQSEARSLLGKVTGGVMKEYRARGFEEQSNRTLTWVLAGICATVGLGSLAVAQYTANGVAWAGVVLAVFLFVIGKGLLKNRTQVGADEAAKAAGLKRFLRDFSRLEDAPVGHLILWERFLVFAVALGVSKELVEGLAVRIPALMNDPAFGSWYVGPHGRFDAFDRISTTTGASYVAASTPKNSSGSGGGFSGGSSGGGGGSGFGAR